MTAEQVIALADRKARERGLRWTLNTGAKIRLNVTGRPIHYECPIEVAAGTGYGLSRALIALNAMGQLASVYRAADNDEIHEPHVRALMLATFDFGQEAGK